MPLEDLRVELRMKNNVLWHVIFDSFESVSRFCETHGFQGTEVGQYLNLTKSPYRENASLRLTASRLCEIGAYTAAELFPPVLYSAAMPKRLAAELSSERFVGLPAAQRMALPAPDPERLMVTEERRSLITAALAKLTPREAQVIRLRFGLENEDEHALGDIGEILGVTKERVRQIEGHALRKLRHPARSRSMRGMIALDVEPATVRQSFPGRLD